MTTPSALIDALRERGLHLALAESLTGGELASSIVAVAGASDVFLGSLVAYSSDIKRDWLKVPDALLAETGAVDPRVAEAMAVGVRTAMAESCGLPLAGVIGAGVTGVAGPSEQDGKPVGTVFGATVGPKGIEIRHWTFSGDRDAVRAAAVQAIVALIAESI